MIKKKTSKSKGCFKNIWEKNQNKLLKILKDKIKFAESYEIWSFCYRIIINLIIKIIQIYLLNVIISKTKFICENKKI